MARIPSTHATRPILRKQNAWRILDWFLTALLLLPIVGANVATAADVSFSVQVNARRIGQDDQVQLTVSLSGSSIDLREDIAPPSVKNLRLIAGPSVSNQFSLTNGRMSQSRSYTYVFQPIDVGMAEIGSVIAKLGQGEKRSEPISIEVVAGSIAPQQQAPQDPFAGFFDRDPFGRAPSRRQPQQVEGKLFLEAAVDRSRVFVGESILLTYYIYTQMNLTGLNFDEAPKYPGFWAEDLPRVEEQPQGEMVTRDGENYTRFAIHRKLLFPTKAGTLTIPATPFKVGIARRGGFFDPSPNGGVISRSTRPVNVTVDPLPEHTNFSGAVGSFKVSTSIDRDDLNLGDAATVKFRIEGNGNLKWIEKAPEMKIPGAKVYPPEIKSDVKVTPTGISGNKTWAFVVIPETVGEVTVPAIPFVFFDPKSKSIIAAQTKPISIKVGQGSGTIAGQPQAPANLPRAATGGLHLRSDLDLPSAIMPKVGASTVVTALIIVGLLHLALLGASLLTGSMRRQQGRETTSRRTVRSALSDLRRAGGGGMSKEAAATLIEHVLVDMFGAIDERAPVGDSELDKALREILQDVHFVRYAPQLGDYSEKIRQVADRAADIVRRMA